MPDRLTDQTELTTKPANGDLVHLVDVSDISDNAAGSSRRMQIQNLLKGRAFQYILGCMVYKTNASPTVTTIQATDFVVFASPKSAQNRLVIGIATDAMTTIPNDLDDDTKFDKFIDTPAFI